ncbi:MAG: type II secretion system F family protein [Candidatus Sumerlaeia bacterium]|nr:type II secretion system F family protein [Candidatus Sumerlaeia bacterium]
MTRPRPSLGMEKFNLDLGSVPFLRGYAAAWNRVYMANREVMTTAKALLFSELASSLGRGVALDDALRLAAGKAPDVSLAGAAGRAWAGLVAFAMFLSMLLVQVLVLAYVGLAGRFSSPERVARLMARNLLRGVERGLPLSRAMAAEPTGFTGSEMRLVEAAESLGTLPATLRELSRDLRTPMLHALQPIRFYLFYLVIAILIGAFLMFKVLPKYVDIFVQLGVELPPLTRFVFEAGALLDSMNPLLVAALRMAVVLLVLVPMLVSVIGPFANGTRLSLQVAALWMGGLVLVPLLLLFHRTIVVGVTSATPWWLLPTLICVAVLMSAAAVPFLLRVFQQAILAGEEILTRVTRPMTRLVAPEVERSRRLDAAARWTQALALAVERRMPEGEALALATLTVAGVWRDRSVRLAERVARGVPLREALAGGPLFGAAMDGAVASAIESPACRELLAHYAVDLRFEAAASAARARKLVELLTLAVVACIVGLLVIALYLPLFQLPLAVMAQGNN